MYKTATKNTLGFASLSLAMMAACWAAPPVQRPDIATTFTGPTEVQMGMTAQYTLKVKNEGAAQAGSVRATLVLPADVELATRVVSTGATANYLPGGCSYTANTRTVACSFGTVAVGESKSAAIGLRMPASASTAVLTARASVLQGTPENVLGNNNAGLQTQVGNFMPALTFPVSRTRLWICMGKASLLECPASAGSAFPLDANGDFVSGNGRIEASAPPGSGTLTLEVYNGTLHVATWSLTPYSSRCYQGPAVYHTLQASYEARVCY